MSLLNHNMMSSFQQIKNLYSMMQQAQNPQALLNQMVKTNPNLAWVMQLCQNSNPRDVFYSMCKERNVNPDDILNQLK